MYSISARRWFGFSDSLKTGFFFRSTQLTRVASGSEATTAKEVFFFKGLCRARSMRSTASATSSPSGGRTVSGEAFHCLNTRGNL